MPFSFLEPDCCFKNSTKTFKTMICSLEKNSKSRFSFFNSIPTQNIPIETITLILKTRIVRLEGSSRSRLKDYNSSESVCLLPR